MKLFNITLRIVAKQLEKDHKLIDKIPKDFHESLTPYLDMPSQARIFGKIKTWTLMNPHNRHDNSRIYKVIKLKGPIDIREYKNTCHIKCNDIRGTFYDKNMILRCTLTDKKISSAHLYYTGSKLENTFVLESLLRAFINFYGTREEYQEFNFNSISKTKIDDFNNYIINKYDVHN